MTWEPITTAPKDKPILVCEVFAFWPEPRHLMTVAMHDMDAWFPVVQSEVTLHPQFWMSLPEPPNA
jgi:hypothetical protein